MRCARHASRRSPGLILCEDRLRVDCGPTRLDISVGGFRVLGGAGARDFAVGFGTAVAIELPGVADFLDFVEIQVGDEEFVFVAAGLRYDLTFGITKITFAVEFTDFPGLLGADAVDSGDEILIGDSVSGLLELPKIFGETCDGGGGIVNNLGAIETEAARAFWEMAVVADVDANFCVAGLENWIAGVTGSEIKFLPEAGMAMRDVVLAVFAEVAAVGIDDRGGVVIDAGHFGFVNGNDENHLMALGEFLHAGHGGAVRDALGQFVPAGLLLRAKVGAVEKLLQAEDLHFFLGGRFDEVLVLGHHFFFDLGERVFFGRPFTTGLNQATTDIASHHVPPVNAGESLLRRGKAHKEQELLDLDVQMAALLRKALADAAGPSIHAINFSS